MNTTEVKQINIKDIVRSGLNPRQVVKRELKESELFQSIKLNGVQHPIEVREIINQDGAGQTTDKQYELLSGERRLAVSEELKVKVIPAIIYTGMTDAEAYEKTHFENLGREDLTPIEQSGPSSGGSWGKTSRRRSIAEMQRMRFPVRKPASGSPD